MDKGLAFELLAICMGVVVFLGILGYAGDVDYCDQVILSMTAEEYDSVKAQIMRENGGDVPSDREIAHWWADNR